MTKTMLTIKEVRAEVFNDEVSVGTLYAMAREGQVPCVRIRGKILFHRPTLDRWLENGGMNQEVVMNGN